jgi:hypothetical protein
MRKYLLAVLAIIAGTVIAAETAQPALDANGNIAKIFIPNIEDRFTIQEWLFFFVGSGLFSFSSSNSRMPRQRNQAAMPVAARALHITKCDANKHCKRHVPLPSEDGKSTGVVVDS